MKYFDIKYIYKTHTTHFRTFVITVRAVDEEDAKRIAYNKIDNRRFVLL